MLSLLTESISNASFGIYMPKFTGTIYELLSAPVSALEIVLGYVGAAATKSIILGPDHPVHRAPYSCRSRSLHPLWMIVVPAADRGDLQPVRLHHRRVGRRLRAPANRSDAGRDAADVPGRRFYSISMLPPVWRAVALFNPVVYLVSGFRWSFYGVSDVSVAVSLADDTRPVLALCLLLVSWIFKTGYRLKN